MAGTLKNYYETLGVPRSATTDQIRTAYRKLLLKFHPDKNVGDPYFEDWSKKVIEAFEVLNDPQVRAEYDKVYDATRKAFRQASRPQEATRSNEATDKEPAQESQEAERESPGFNTTTLAQLEALAPAYLAAKKAELQASRKLKGLEQQAAGLSRLQSRYRQLIYVAGGLGLLALIWLLAGQIRRPDSPNKPVATQQPEAPAANRESAVPAPAPAAPAAAKGEEIASEGRIVVPKAYFHPGPSDGAITGQFLSKGDKISITRKSGRYYYVIVKDWQAGGPAPEGWIRNSQVEIQP